MTGPNPSRGEGLQGQGRALNNTQYLAEVVPLGGFNQLLTCTEYLSISPEVRG